LQESDSEESLYDDENNDQLNRYPTYNNALSTPNHRADTSRSKNQPISSQKSISARSSIAVVQKQGGHDSNIYLRELKELLLELKEQANITKILVENLTAENKQLKESINATKESVETIATKAGKKKSEDSFKTEIIYKNKNLLDVHASSISKYVTKLMEILFTKDELFDGYIKAENSNSKRTDLDKDRVLILQGTLHL